MKPIGIALLMLAGCGSAEQPVAQGQGSDAAALVQPAVAPNAKSTVLPIPTDKAQLERLQAMGYKLHADHLDPPGAASCPKMSENPVQ